MTITYPISNPVGNPVVAPSSGPTLLDSISGLNTEFELDVTLEASYSGSGQTWANVIESPNSGAAQTAYDFYLGDSDAVSSNDPTFTGTAGDSGAYWALDGVGYFEEKNTATMLRKMARTDASGFGACWMAIAFYLGSVDANMAFFGNSGLGAGEHGIRNLMNATENLRFQQRGDSSFFNNVAVPDGTWSATTDHIYIVGFNSKSAGSEKYWANSATGASFANAYAPEACTSDAALNFQIAASDTAFKLPNGSRIYAFAGGAGIPSDGDVASLISTWETRHGRDYTP